MSAQSIEWHEQCLANSIESHKRYVDELERAIKNERRSRLDNERYAEQIKKAKKLGKKSFDSNRFAGGLWAE